MMKLLPHQPQASHSSAKLRLLGGVLLLSMLTACGGSGAGDNDNTDELDNTAGMAVEPLVGVWNLPDDWNGEANDEAYLLIRSPDETGVASAVVYDFDDVSTGLGQNCYIIDSEGSVSPSLGNKVFMDISPFPDAVVSLNATGDLDIVYTIGESTSTNRETTTIMATPLGFTESDITPIC